jgi:hypothetical protein
MPMMKERHGLTIPHQKGNQKQAWEAKLGQQTEPVKSGNSERKSGRKPRNGARVMQTLDVCYAADRGE